MSRKRAPPKVDDFTAKIVSDPEKTLRASLFVRFSMGSLQSPLHFRFFSVSCANCNSQKSCRRLDSTWNQLPRTSASLGAAETNTIRIGFRCIRGIRSDGGDFEISGGDFELRLVEQGIDSGQESSERCAASGG